MEFEERKKVIGFLKSIEIDFPVNKWSCEDISLWPLVKSISFFTKNSTKKKTVTSPVLNKIKRVGSSVFGLFNAYGKIVFLKKNKKTNLFLGEGHFRVMLESKSFNKYFDPIMDYLDEEGLTDSVSLELTKVTDKYTYYRNDRLIDIKAYYPYFKLNHKKVSICFHKLEDFDKVLKQISDTVNISVDEIKKRIENHFNDILIWEKIADFFYRKMQPKNVFVLCYYTIPAFGFNLSAKKNKITTVDIQHGGQGDFHPFYNFANIPENGFSILPTFFWNWDTSSFNTLNNTFSKIRSHKAMLGGNVWSDYLSNVKFELKKDKKIILYTMQTTLKPVLHNYIIEGIKRSTNEYLWWLRLHPRMTELETVELLGTLKDAEVLDKVRIDYGKDIPLPFVLMNCFAHLSHFSGCILEATLLKVKINIVIGETGKKFYKELLKNKEAYYFNPNEDKNIFNKIENLLNNTIESTSESRSEINYKKILKANFIGNERV